jgi:hypothetical protein
LCCLCGANRELFDEEDNVKTKPWCGVMLSAAVMFSSCAPMIRYSTTIPAIKAPQDKALVVIVRPLPKTGASYNADKMGTIFIDGIFGCVNTDNTITQVAVDTGEHYIMAVIDNISTLKFSFKAGKIYYLVQKISSRRVTAPTPGTGAPSGGLTRVQTTLEPVTQDEFKAMQGSADLRFAQFAQSKPLKNMDPPQKKAHIMAYEFWAKAKPDLARANFDYPGY